MKFTFGKFYLRKKNCLSELNLIIFTWIFNNWKNNFLELEIKLTFHKRKFICPTGSFIIALQLLNNII